MSLKTMFLCFVFYHKKNGFELPLTCLFFSVFNVHQFKYISHHYVALRLNGLLLLFFSILYKHLENIAEIISERSTVISWTLLPFELASLGTLLFIIINKNQFLQSHFINKVHSFPFLCLRNPHLNLSFSLCLKKSIMCVYWYLLIHTTCTARYVFILSVSKGSSKFLNSFDTANLSKR